MQLTVSTFSSFSFKAIVSFRSYSKQVTWIRLCEFILERDTLTLELTRLNRVMFYLNCENIVIGEDLTFNGFITLTSFLITKQSMLILKNGSVI